MITGTYNLAVDPLWKNVQLQEVFLECDTTSAPVTINLFEISQLNRFWNVKIVVSDVNNNAETNNITINASGSDTMDDSATVQVVLNANGESVALQVASQTKWLATESVSGGGGNALVNIVYADLYNKIVNSQLVVGTKYRLTDYKSVNFLNGANTAEQNPSSSNPVFNPREIYTSQDEVLILEAISTYQLNPVAKSETYPNDIVEYQAFTNAIGVKLDYFTGKVLPDSYTVTDFNLKWDAINNQVYFDMPTGYPLLFGHYMYLYAGFSGFTYSQDGIFLPLTPVISYCSYQYKPTSNLSISTDGMRVVLLDLTYNDFLNYDADSLYIDTQYELGQAYGYVTKRIDTTLNITTPFDFRGRKYRRYEVDLSSNTSFGIVYAGTKDVTFIAGSNRTTTGNYIDVPCFNFSQEVYNVVIQGRSWIDANYWWYGGDFDNTVFLNRMKNNTLSGYLYNNTFLNNTEQNNIIVGSSFYDNLFNVCFNMNGTILTANENCIKSISALILNNVSMSGNNIESINVCSIGYGFSANTFRNNFWYVDFPFGISGCNFVGNLYNISSKAQIDSLVDTSGSDFQYVTFDTYMSGGNFTSSTFVHQYTTCTIGRASTNALFLSYFDGTSLQFVAYNA